MAAAFLTESRILHQPGVDMKERSWMRKDSLSIDTDCACPIKSFETPSTIAPDSPVVAQIGPTLTPDSRSPSTVLGESRKLMWDLSLDSPASRDDNDLDFGFGFESTQDQPSNVKRMREDLKSILFDFDGTLTSVPGQESRGVCKRTDLLNRSSILAPNLQAMRNAGITLGIISKCDLATIQSAIQAAGLADYFNGPLLAKVGGIAGKARAISELCRVGGLEQLGVKDLGQILLVDDDFTELEHALTMGIQTYPAARGGLQDADLKAILEHIALVAQ